VTGVPDITLNNGNTIPQFGFGVFRIRPEDTAEVRGPVACHRRSRLESSSG